MACSGDAAMMLGVDIARMNMPWWVVLVVMLAGFALAAFRLSCRYRLGTRALDKVASRDVEKVIRVVMDGLNDGRGKGG